MTDTKLARVWCEECGHPMSARSGDAILAHVLAHLELHRRPSGGLT